LLVRYDAIKGIDIPEDLHVFEDAFIAEWITKRGYRLVPAYDPYCIHYRPSAVWTIKGSIDIIVDTLRYGSIAKMPKLTLAYGFYTVYVLYRSFLVKKV
jgi:hypothetical protein